MTDKTQQALEAWDYIKNHADFNDAGPEGMSWPSREMEEALSVIEETLTEQQGMDVDIESIVQDAQLAIYPDFTPSDAELALIRRAIGYLTEKGHLRTPDTIEADEAEGILRNEGWGGDLDKAQEKIEVAQRADTITVKREDVPDYEVKPGDMNYEAREGYAVVPIEPTREMLISVGTMEGYDASSGQADNDHIEWWKAMIKAALLTESEE